MANIILYPSNWLYNAGVVGFLNCLERDDYLIKYNGSKFTLTGNYVKVNNQVFQSINIDENYFENGKVINLKGKNQYYPNFIDTSGNQKWVFKKFVEAFYANNNDYNLSYCSLCSNPIYVNKENIQPQSNDQTQKPKDDFFNKIENLNMVHNKILGPSDKFPNAYWNFNDKFKICHLCTFILIHHHLALTKLSDGSEIIINAPSFKVMYEMNKLVKELFGKEDTPGKQKRELLAMSVIEYSRRLNASLGMWNMMTLEIIVKSRDGIDSFSLPYETVNLISDRKIASLLSEIGEFSILNIVLNGENNKLIDIGHKLIRIGIKSYQDRNKSDNAIVNSFLHKGSNKTNIINTAQKILELYANITERRKKYA